MAPAPCAGATGVQWTIMMPPLDTVPIPEAAAASNTNACNREQHAAQY